MPAPVVTVQGVSYVLRPSFRRLAVAAGPADQMFSALRSACRSPVSVPDALWLVWNSLPSGHGLTRPALEDFLYALPAEQCRALVAALARAALGRALD